MPRFSANLGFLWTELPLPDAIRAAKLAGFHAVECHFPYDVPTSLVQRTLAENDIEMIGINTRRGNVDNGDNGLCALPDRVDEARSVIDQAIDYAAAIDCPTVHVMAGCAAGALAERTFVENLRYACIRASQHNITILIEPLNTKDAPGYFLSTTGQAVGILEAVSAANIKIMLDLYHVQLMEGALEDKIRNLMPYIGHIQFAGVPDRGPPDSGDIDFDPLFKLIDGLGYNRPLGAEYKPNGSTEQSLDWLKRYL
ncbi:hydroxypyruvate isomerase family protein [Ahrensia marina]|uniref:Isomerase n=1 Tax=Ahrensia marina TaxID=1514904 RepID=A0A0N0E7S9_9HYPH|nr:TIM barrel protein [Ahrensia marina]KPB01442.1 isomerase [Ahrensia marina]